MSNDGSMRIDLGEDIIRTFKANEHGEDKIESIFTSENVLVINFL